MSEFNFGKISINPEKSSAKSDARENLIDSKIKNNPMDRRNFIFASVATLALSAIPKETGTTTSLLKRLIEYTSSDLKEHSSDNEKINNLSETEKLKQQLREESLPSAEMEALAYEMQGKARLLLKDENIFPKKLFTDNFFAAVQIQESNLKNDAYSDKGALGVMQVRPITIKEDVRYLNILEKNGNITFEGPRSKELSEKDIRDLITLTMKNSDLGEALGKLYFADLFDNFKIGQDIFALGDLTKARKKLLAAYNWNPDNFKRNEHNESTWPKETREYCDKVLKNIASLNLIQKEIVQLKIHTDAQELSTFLTIELNRYQDTDTNDPLFLELVRSYLGGIQTTEMALGRPLKREEIKKTLDKRNHASYRLYANNNIADKKTLR